MADSTRITFSDQYKRIVVEDARALPFLLKMYADIYNNRRIYNLGFNSLWGFCGTSMETRPTTVRRKRSDLDEERLADMDAAGIDFAILFLRSPGAQALIKPVSI